jgi:hypothetical protein
LQRAGFIACRIRQRFFRVRQIGPHVSGTRIHRKRSLFARRQCRVVKLRSGRSLRQQLVAGRQPVIPATSGQNRIRVRRCLELLLQACGDISDKIPITRYFPVCLPEIIPGAIQESRT